jgi:hypothetical protein
MFRSSTGEAWQEIMLSCVKDPSVECDPKVKEHATIMNTLMKNIRKFSSYIRKFRWERLQRHILGRAS